MLNNVKAFLFDIGSTLISGPHNSPTKQISKILFENDQESESIAHIIMKNDFPGPKHLIDHLSRVYQISLRQSQEIEILWQEQEIAAKEIEGASQTLRALKHKGYKLGVLSDIWKPYYLSFCRACPDILNLLECQILSFREGIKKPSLELLLRAAKGLGATPEETIMVGDTYLQDIKPAIELKFKTVWYLSRPEKETEALREVIMGGLPKPDRVITNLEQLLY